jgi:hypothetical protein
MRWPQGPEYQPEDGCIVRAMKKLMPTILVITALILPSCASVEPNTAVLPHRSFNPEMIFPADRSLTRPEDGVVLTDGRLIVADQVDGLRLVRADGSKRPFGELADAGYLQSPPEIVGGANGVTLEPAGTHILISNVFRSGIYRVEIATEATERVYQHHYGPQYT